MPSTTETKYTACAPSSGPQTRVKGEAPEPVRKSTLGVPETMKSEPQVRQERKVVIELKTPRTNTP